MKKFLLLSIILPALVFAQPFDTGVRTDKENDWTADQTFGNVTVGGRIVVPSGSSGAPSLALGDGNSGFYESGDNEVNLSLNAVSKYRWRLGEFSGINGAGYFWILNSAASATAPIYTFNGDLNTGIGRASPDSLSLIAGGVEAARAAEGAGNNSIIFTVNGDFVIGSSGNITGNTNIRGSDSFDALAIADTILNDDFAAGDNYQLTLTFLASMDSVQVLWAEGVEDTLIVHRLADGDADQTYNWWRIK